MNLVRKAWDATCAAGRKAVGMAKSALVAGVAVITTASLTVSTEAMAFTPTSIDTANAVSQIGEIETAIAAIGAALMVAAAVAVAFKWAKAAIFG